MAPRQVIVTILDTIEEATDIYFDGFVPEISTYQLGQFHHAEAIVAVAHVKRLESEFLIGSGVCVDCALLR